MPSLNNSEAWKRLEELFNQAVELDASAREEFLSESCADSPEMRRELESLLNLAEEPDDRLGRVIHSAAHDVWTTRKPALLAAGSRFGRYECLSLLGAGGMGQVYLAQDLELGRKVALKTLPSNIESEGQSLRRFKQEAQSASALNHPNILTIYEVGECNGTHFIAAEFVEGQTVREKLANGALSLHEASSIAIQIAAGLEAAHASGIVHRDVKPENVIVRKDGLVKIVDFGIARVSRERPAKAARAGANSRIQYETTPGTVFGTARYMSPEQARGTLVDSRSDVFSLGSVMYEMVSGTAPFEGSTDSDLIAEILKTDPPALNQLTPPVPLAFSRIIAKAMAKDREQRYTSMSDLLHDLRTFQEDASFQAKLQTSKFSAYSTRRMAMLALCVFALLAAGYLVRSLIRTQPAERPRSLAILPFRNIKQDPATDFLGYSLADAVITKMGFISSLIVRPSSSIDRYRNQVIDPQKTGAELNVDTLLTGSFIKEGDDLRINTQLIDVKHIRVLWQDTIDIKYQNLLAVQDRVAEQIINGLALKLSPLEAGHVKFDNAISGSAYESYLRGVDLYALNDFSSAITALEKSASMDPGYALTWAHLGRAYTTHASLQFGGTEQYRKALASYQNAIQLNPALIEPRVYMANLFTDTGRVEEALPLLLAALKENRNSAEAHWELGYALRFAGLLEESKKESEQARQLDPEVKINSSALNTYLYLGEYDKFLASLPSRDSAYILFYRGFGEYHKEDYARANTHLHRAFELDPSLLQTNVGEAMADALKHKNAAGLKLLHELEARIWATGMSDAEGIYKVSQAYMVLGDLPSALRLLRRTISGGFFCYPYFRSDPLASGLRADPEFQKLMIQAQERSRLFRIQYATGLNHVGN